MRNGAQHKVVGVEVFRPLALDSLNLGITQTRLDGAHYAQRDFVLQCEDVFEPAIVTFGPQVNGGFRLDQLGIDPDTLTRLAAEYVTGKGIYPYETAKK